MDSNQINMKMDLSDLNIRLNDNVRYSGGSSQKLSNLLVIKGSKWQFPNVGDKEKLYLDKSTGDVFMYGLTGDFYVSVGVATGDTIYGGDASSVYQ